MVLNRAGKGAGLIPQNIEALNMAAPQDGLLAQKDVPQKDTQPRLGVTGKPVRDFTVIVLADIM